MKLPEFACKSAGFPNNNIILDGLPMVIVVRTLLKATAVGR